MTWEVCGMNGSNHIRRISVGVHVFHISLISHVWL
jgi:hypothetical protein